MRLILPLVILALVVDGQLLAEEIDYTFSGATTFVFAHPYGITPVGTAVTGTFEYDPSSPATEMISGGTGYEQFISNGFTATIGGIQLQSSDYLVSIFDNVKEPDNSLKDVITVSFSNQQGLSPSAALDVNGVAHTVGFLQVSFLAPSSLFSGTALPGMFSPSSFVTTQGLFSDTPTGPLDVLFSVTVVPEPSGVVLALVGGIGCLAALKRRSSRRRRA